jgi:hypothetical protein
LTKRLLRKALADAARDIDNDERTAGKRYLLMNDGCGCGMGTEHLTRGALAPSAERAANRTAGVEAVRRYLRAIDLTRAAAVLIGEAWETPMEGYETGRPGDGNRGDVLVVPRVTRRFGRAGVSTGSSGVGRLNWQPPTNPAPLTDGIFCGSRQVR